MQGAGKPVKVSGNRRHLGSRPPLSFAQEREDVSAHVCGYLSGANRSRDRDGFSVSTEETDAIRANLEMLLEVFFDIRIKAVV